MGVQRAINGQLITWEVIVYGFLGMEQVAARLTAAAAASAGCRGQLYKADFKILFTFYKLSGIMEREPHEEAGQWNSDMIRNPGFP